MFDNLVLEVMGQAHMVHPHPANDVTAHQSAVGNHHHMTMGMAGATMATVSTSGMAAVVTSMPGGGNSRGSPGSMGNARGLGVVDASSAESAEIDRLVHALLQDCANT